MPTTASTYQRLVAVLALFAALTGVIVGQARPAGALSVGVSGFAGFFTQTTGVTVNVSPDEALGSRLRVAVFGNGVSCDGETGTFGVTTDPPGTTEFTADPLLRNGRLPRTTVPCIANGGDRMVGLGGVYVVVIEVQWTENGQLRTVMSPPGMTRDQVATLVTFNVLHPDGIRSVTPLVPRMTGTARLDTFVSVPTLPV